MAYILFRGAGGLVISNDPGESVMPHRLRRAFVIAIPLGVLGPELISATLAPTLAATKAVAKTPVSITPLAQIRIGCFTVTALTDRYADMPYNYFPGRDAAEVEKSTVAQFTARKSGVRFLFNQYLIEDGERRILIDGRCGGLDRADG